MYTQQFGFNNLALEKYPKTFLTRLEVNIFKNNFYRRYFSPINIYFINFIKRTLTVWDIF